jgi:ribosome recycling factor
MEQIITDAQKRMSKSIDALRGELSKIRTGKATPALLEGIKIDYYGTPTPLQQVGNVTVLDAHSLSITPWDKSMVNVIDKAILAAGLGLNPVSDGTNLRIPIPPLTEERRKDMVKMIKKIGEDNKIAIRNIRRDANERLKKSLKDKLISEDDLKEAEEKVQKITNDSISSVEEVLKHKEKELMEV